MITIDPEFKALIPPLTPAEYDQLTLNLLADGCRDPLVVWGNILIDGHNRHAICQAYDLPFQTITMAFASRNEAIFWIIKNQLGRRNLTPTIRTELAQRLKPIIEAQARENQAHGQTAPNKTLLTNLSKALQPVNTRKILADMAGVSEGTFDKIETVLERGPEPLKEALRKGDISADAAFKEVKRAEQKAERAAVKVELYAPQASKITLLHGDMRAIIPTLPHRYQLIVADPPYNVTKQEWDKFSTPKAFLEDMANWLDLIGEVVASEYNLFWFCSPTYMADVEMLLRPRFEIQSRIVWHRRNMSMGSDAKYRFLDSWELCFHCGNRPLNYPDKWDDSRFDVMTFAVPQTNFEDAKLHPTQKPLGLIERLVAYGSYPGDYILDPFAGSGTTGEAVLSQGDRFCTLIEREGQYCQIIKERLGL